MKINIFSHLTKAEIFASVALTISIGSLIAGITFVSVYYDSWNPNKWYLIRGICFLISCPLFGAFGYLASKKKFWEALTLLFISTAALIALFLAPGIAVPAGLIFLGYKAGKKAQWW